MLFDGLQWNYFRVVVWLNSRMWREDEGKGRKRQINSQLETEKFLVGRIAPAEPT